jgi:hypothetical protein
MTAPIKMTKEQMREGFSRGRTLIQEEWANPQEIKWIDELISEGVATATPWEYKDNFQCERRRVSGVVQEKAG